MILILPREKPLPKENLGFMASRTALEQSPLHAKPEGSKPGSPAAHDLGIDARRDDAGAAGHPLVKRMVP